MAIFNQIPQDLWGDIFKYLSDKDLNELEKTFQETIYDYQKWARVLTLAVQKVQPFCKTMFPDRWTYRNIGGTGHGFLCCVDVCWSGRYRYKEWTFRITQNYDYIMLGCLILTSMVIHGINPTEEAEKVVWETIKRMTNADLHHYVCRGKEYDVTDPKTDLFDITGC